MLFSFYIFKKVNILAKTIRFHELSEFDEAKRSCRRRLAGHNERRRKNSMEFKGTGKELVCVQSDDRRFQMVIQENQTYNNNKHLQTR